MARPEDNRSAPDPPPRLVVPAYFHPAIHPGQWQWLAEHARRVRLVILNIHNGPGSGPEAPFREVTDRLRRAGVPVVGYVDTNYGSRPADQVVTELSQYLDWYEVDGVCLDRVATASASVPYYGAMSARARKLGAEFVFFNHGTHPNEAYAQHADLLGTFEGPWHAYRKLDVPPWTTAWPTEKFYHVVYSVPAERFGEAAKLAVIRHAAAVYITERGGANPYDLLPIDTRSLDARFDRIQQPSCAGMATAGSAGGHRDGGRRRGGSLRGEHPGGQHPGGQHPGSQHPGSQHPGSQPFHGYGEELLAAGYPGILLLRIDLGAGGRHQAAAE